MTEVAKDSPLSRVFTTNGIHATHLRFAYSENDLLDSNFPSYEPTHCHQVYNSNETIFGYKKLKINIWYNALTLNCYLDIKYSQKLKENSLQKADDIEKLLAPWLPKNYTTDEKQFVASLTQESSQLFGKIKESFRKNMIGRNRCDFKITENNTDDHNFRDLHQRFQTMIVWYIDAASFIDLSDYKWTVFYLYEYRNKKHYPVGFCTVYRFYRYPDKVRARISQFFILPSHQRAGLGTRLLKTVYKTFWNEHNVADITVEDPSLGFQRMRDIVDCNLLCELKHFSQAYVIKEHFSKVVAQKAESCYKICYRQSRRVYEILNLLYAGRNGNLLMEWCKRVKKRLWWPYEKDMRVFKRKNFGYYHKSLLKQRSLYAKPKEVVDNRFKKYLDEIFPLVVKLQIMKQNEVVKYPCEVRKIWARILSATSLE